MQAKKMFRGALFGYNKKDVCDYILKMSSESDDRTKNLESKNKEFSEKTEALIKENEQLSSELAQKTRDFYESSQKLSELEKNCERLLSREGDTEGRFNELRETIAVKEEEIAYHRSSLESLKSRCSLLESEINRYIEDKVSIANAMIDAKRQAGDIVEKARGDAGEVVSRAREYIKRASYELSLLSAQVDEARSKIIGAYTGADIRASEAASYIESLEEELGLLLTEDIFAEGANFGEGSL